jgi:hypothetical protein
MKTRILIASVALCTLTACQSAPLFNKSETVEQVTNTFSTVATVTNDVGGVVTVTNLVQVPVLITNTVYTVATQIVDRVQMVRDTGSAIAAVAPPAAPFVGTVNAILGFGITLLGAFATVKTQLAKKHKTTAQKTATMLRAVVVGVEAVNQPSVKESISKHATVLGVAGALDEVVQKVTKEATR